MWEPKELLLDWRHPWARTVGACRFHVFGGLRPGRDQGLLHIPAKVPDTFGLVWSLSSLSRPCRGVSSLSWSLVWSHVAWSLSCLVWLQSLSRLRSRFVRSAGSGHIAHRQHSRGDPRPGAFGQAAVQSSKGPEEASLPVQAEESEGGRCRRSRRLAT